MPPLCDNCTELPAIERCEDCEELFCEACSIVLHKNPKRAVHVRIPLGFQDEPTTEESSERSHSPLSSEDDPLDTSHDANRLFRLVHPESQSPSRAGTPMSHTGTPKGTPTVGTPPAARASRLEALVGSFCGFLILQARHMNGAVWAASASHPSRLGEISLPTHSCCVLSPGRSFRCTTNRCDTHAVPDGRG